MAGIYIHIPFCKQKCTYCDFTSYPKKLCYAEAYFACLYKEIKLRSESLKHITFDTIYFGGGTPSIVKAEYIAGAIKQIRNLYNLSQDLEITIEMNPATVDSEKIRIYKKAGVNRFSVGMQSADDNMLRKLNRIHTSQDFLDSVKLLEGENVSADILIGLENQTTSDVQKSIDLAIKGKVSHISMYALKAEEGTPIFSNYLKGDLPSEDEVRDLYDFGVKYMKERNYYRYEVSNFAKRGFESKHNLNYWKRGKYIGFGISASSFIGDRRFTNTDDFDDYMKCIISNHYPVVDDEEVVGDEAKFEYIMLALRTSYGIKLDEYKELFGKDFLEEYKTVINKQKSYLDITDRSVKIKDEYLYVQNNLVVEYLN